MRPPLIVYWARRDLRLVDNPALTKAIEVSLKRRVPLLPLFILERYMSEALPSSQFGFPSRIFLSRALPPFLSQFPSHLLARGVSVDILSKLHESYVLRVYVNDDTHPDFYRDIRALEARGIRVHVLEDALTIPKSTITSTGKTYSIFTPFKRAVWDSFVKAKPLARLSLKSVQFAGEKDVSLIRQIIPTISLEERAIIAACTSTRVIALGNTHIDLDTLTDPPLLDGWYWSEKEAQARFDHYLREGMIDQYDTSRNFLDKDTKSHACGHNCVFEGTTSRMSLALAWGLLSPRMLVSAIQAHFNEPFDNPRSRRVPEGVLMYISELIWREFYLYLLFHHPDLLTTEFQPRFRGTIPWVEDEEALRRFTLWIKGETGYEIVDAAMKQIAGMGWMHNRARMVVASILTKHLAVNWRWGQEYFRAALIDIDDASNNGGWQWGASVGADPKPIRIFNPELQAKNYDPSGAYRAKWLPNSVLRGETPPLIPHTVARQNALERYGLTKKKIP